MDYSRPPLADRLAAEYVSGTLRGPARRRFESLLPAHPALRTAVSEWQWRLIPLTAAIEPVAPPAAVWARIEARIAPAASQSETAPRMPWWNRLAVWRSLTGGALATALALAVLNSAPGPARPPIVVVLSATGPAAGVAGATPASFVASISSDGRAMVTRPITNVSVSPDRSLELWAVPASGDPRSLGLISADGTTIVKKGKVLENTTALAVTLEPPSGSSTGKPTGPIVYLGKLQL